MCMCALTKFTKKKDSNTKGASKMKTWPTILELFSAKVWRNRPPYIFERKKETNKEGKKGKRMITVYIS